MTQLQPRRLCRCFAPTPTRHSVGCHGLKRASPTHMYVIQLIVLCCRIRNGLVPYVLKALMATVESCLSKWIDRPTAPAMHAKCHSIGSPTRRLGRSKPPSTRLPIPSPALACTYSPPQAAAGPASSAGSSSRIFSWIFFSSQSEGPFCVTVSLNCLLWLGLTERTRQVWISELRAAELRTAAKGPYIAPVASLRRI
jgi:hypothetical protein